MSASAALADLPPAVAAWRDQIERLSELASPCRYLLPAKWAAMRANALAFLDRFGAESHRLGWTPPQLFGVHPEHGFLRVEYAGALMVNGNPVVAVENERIVFDRFSGYRNKQGQTWGPPVWEFARKGTGR
jgi:anaerobic glycerol-3-phosphate dehydrogenase